jgi:predicted TIM-barrel fold metal-dependent hydrolase
MSMDIHAHAFHPKIAAKTISQLQEHYDIQARGNGLVEDLLARERAAGIARVAVHTAATAPSQVIPANNWALDLARNHPEIEAFGTMHPDFPDMETELDRLRQAGIRGLKFHADFQGFFLDDPHFYRVLEAAGNDFVLMFHVGDRLPPEKNPSCPLKLARIRRAFPGPAIIAAHFGGYLHWDWAIEHLAGSDVYMDTSSALPFMSDEQLQAILSRHPFERLLFGSDYPLADPGEEMELVRRRLRLSDSRLTDLLENAERLFADVNAQQG